MLASESRPQALSADVYDLLVDKLFDPSYRPGARLNIDRLAAEWGVSQTPVREALSRAAATGLVVREQHKGFQVAPLLPHSRFQAVVDARALIEPFCAGRAATLASDDELAALVMFNDTMDQIAAHPDADEYRSYLRADIGWHRGIVAAARNPFLLQAFDDWNIHFFRFQRFRGDAAADVAGARPEHRAVMDALLCHDPEASFSAMTAHVTGVRHRS